MNPRPQTQPVRQRQVFYISGFDPRGPSHYHQLYCTECAKQSAVNGLLATVGPRKNSGAHETTWRIDTTGTVVDYSLLRWDDLVRSRWPRTAAAIVADVIRGTWGGARAGIFGLLLRTSWPTFVNTAFPPALLLAVAFVTLAAAVVAAMLFADVLGAWRYGAAMLVLCLPLAAIKPLLEYYNVLWLAGIGVFLVDQIDGGSPEIDARCAEFAMRIAQAARSGSYDEVLVISHSVGAMLAVRALARALDGIPEGASVSFLTLGQPIAMAAYQPNAGSLRRDLRAVALSPKIGWIDVTAPIDSSCIPLTDPVIASGADRPPGAIVQPKLISARFVRLFTPAGYKHVRFNFMRAHFQYIMAAEIAGSYDYFLITAGNMRLWDRYAGQDSVNDFNRLRLKLR
ncbi:MAG: hypothetical protein ACT4SY_01550 [Hyphomicrobiales bacterium]